MKKIVTAALLSVLVAAPALADDASSRKSAPTKSRMTQGTKDGCDVEHNMRSHHDYGMTGGEGASMMMEPNMHMLGTLALSQEQQAKINKLSDEFKHNNWATQGLFNDETAKLRDLYEADKRDPAAIGKEYQRIFDLKRQMIEAYLDTENNIEEILTPEQRAKMKEARNKMRHMYGHPMQ